MSLDQDLRSQLNGMLVFNGRLTQTLTSKPPERYHSIFKPYGLPLGGKRRILPLAETRKATVLTHHQWAGIIGDASLKESQTALVLLLICSQNNVSQYHNWEDKMLIEFFM